MQRYLKPFRIVISLVVLLAIGFLFLDFSNTLSSKSFQNITWLQFTPSVLKFFETMTHGLALTAFGFLVVLLFTLLFGRIYCSYICPLGIFQDGVNWISRKTRNKKNTRFRFAPPKTWMRYAILVMVILSLFTGSILLVNLFDPYSIFGRFASDLFRPVYMLANNLFVNIFEAMGSYILYPVTIAKTDPYALIIPVITLSFIVWLSFTKGRLYCNSICPVGTLLGLVSKVSLFKIHIDRSGCNQCGKCMFACKSQCIDVKQQQVDFSRCVGCGNCIKACDKNSISYKLLPAQKPKLQRTDTSKRHFVAGSLLFIAAFSGLSIKALAQKRNRKKQDDQIKGSGKGTGNEEVVKTHTVTPPGSINFNHFTDACTACHLCVSACPTGVLKPSFLEYGFFGMMQPYMDYHTDFCNFECVRCTEICPTGAILPLTTAQKTVSQIGIVRFVKNNCIVFTDETSCGSCSEHCPTQAVKMVHYKDELTIPEVNTDICVGCGACEYACPVTPYKAIVVDGCMEHQVAQKPKEEALDEKPIEDFPF